jgi:hypothetical protein
MFCGIFKRSVVVVNSASTWSSSVVVFTNFFNLFCYLSIAAYKKTVLISRQLLKENITKFEKKRGNGKLDVFFAKRSSKSWLSYYTYYRSTLITVF